MARGIFNAESGTLKKRGHTGKKRAKKRPTRADKEKNRKAVRSTSNEGGSAVEDDSAIKGVKGFNWPFSTDDIWQIYSLLKQHYGPQTRWWPGEGTFEVVIGAVLTQNTAWANVDKALKNLRKAHAVTPQALASIDEKNLEELIRPAGFYRQKASRLKAVSNLFLGGASSPSRDALLAIKGIGKETADSILLYGYNKPFFVVDAYTKRLVCRISGACSLTYDEIQAVFESGLREGLKKNLQSSSSSLPFSSASVGLAEIFKELHALIVEHAKAICLKRAPKCESCPLKAVCKKEGINATHSTTTY